MTNVTTLELNPAWLARTAAATLQVDGNPGLGAAQLVVSGSSSPSMTSPPGGLLPLASLRAATLVPLLLQALVLAAAVWLLSSWWRRYARFRSMELAIPGGRSYPVIGNAFKMVGINEDNAFQTVLGLWGGYTTELSRCTLLNYMIVFVSDPDHIGKVMRDRRFLDKPWMIYSPMADVLGRGLVTADAELWKRHRAVVQPTFHLEILERFVEVFAEEAAGFVERLRPLQGRDVEFAEEMHRATANSVLKTTLSSTIEEQYKADVEMVVEGVTSSLQRVNARSLRPWLWPSALFNLTAMGREQERYNRITSDFMDGLIERKTKEILAREETTQLESKLGFKERKTFLDLVLEAKLSSQMDFSHQEIKDEMKTIFGTAVETSVTALTFVFKMLSIRPDVQERVFAEIHDVFQGSDREVTSSDLPRLEYTERVIKETLRIFPIGPFVARHVNEDTELCGKMIPAGSALVVNIFSAHRDPRHHPEPLHFDPDRFLPERTAQWHPYCYLPFSAGPRNCIGKQYAMMQMKSILCTTLRAYRLEPANDGITHPSQFPLTFDIALRLVGGTKVRFEPRTPASQCFSQ